MFAQSCGPTPTFELPGTKLELTAPDDWHHHLRDGPALATTVPAAARQFKRAIIMPKQPGAAGDHDRRAAIAYRGRILDALHASGAPAGSFEPLMTLYLTDSTPPEEVKRNKRAAERERHHQGVQALPGGRHDRNSASGVTDLDKCAARSRRWRSTGSLCACTVR